MKCFDERVDRVPRNRARDKTSAQAPTRYLWRHQNGMWKFSILIGPFVPRDQNTRFWMATRYTDQLILLNDNLHI